VRAPAGDLLFVSGQVPLRDGTLLADAPFGEQAQQVLANVTARLEEHGGSLADVVKCTVYLTDMADFDEFNRHYAAAFAEPYPARTAVAVAALPFGVRVEVDAFAVLAG